MTTLYLVWRQPSQRWWPIGRLTRNEEQYVFTYTRGALSAHAVGFQPLMEFPVLDRRYCSPTLFPAFQNRLYPKNRREHADIQRWADLTEPEAADPLVVLARTLGPRVTDVFEVFAEPEATADGRYSAIFFAHGLAHRSAEERALALTLLPGAHLRIDPVAANAVDPCALRLVSACGTQVGFVPRYLNRDFRSLGEASALAGLWATVRRVNSDAPPQFHLLCSLEARWPAGFEPCAQEEYQAIDAAADIGLSQPVPGRRAAG
jgi:hypothetical protein